MGIFLDQISWHYKKKKNFFLQLTKLKILRLRNTFSDTEMLK